MPPLNLPNFEPTVWEQKLRAYRLKNETPEVRAWREEAEDPNTTGERLDQIDDALREQARGGAEHIFESIARHPNTPLDSLIFLIHNDRCGGAFCQNPVARFVLLEMPDFIVRLHDNGGLLREENIPLPLLNAIAGDTDNHYSRIAQHQARLHVALSGEVNTVIDGETQVTDYWREHLVFLAAQLKPAEEDRHKNRPQWERLNRFLQMNAELMELGLAPDWVSTPPIDAEPNPLDLPQQGRALLKGTVRPGSRKEQRIWSSLAPFLSGQPALVSSARRDASANQLATLVDLLEEHKTADRWEASGLVELIAAHPNAAPVILKRLVRLITTAKKYSSLSSSDLALRLITTNPNASTDLIRRLAQHSDPEVRRLARRHKNAPSNVLNLSRQVLFTKWADASNVTEYFVAECFENFVAGLWGRTNVDMLRSCGTNWMAARRLTAALALPVEPITLPNKPENESAQAGCTTRDLLEHLARDGNRLVRWAAQTRLRNPDYVFRWAEPE